MRGRGAPAITEGAGVWVCRQVELLSIWLSRRGQRGETCAHRELLDGARESDVLGLALFVDGVEGHYVAWFVVLQRAPERHEKSYSLARNTSRTTYLFEVSRLHHVIYSPLHTNNPGEPEGRFGELAVGTERVHQAAVFDVEALKFRGVRARPWAGVTDPWGLNH